jgi:hypothetical protein
MALRICVLVLCTCLLRGTLANAQTTSAASHSYPPTLWVPCDKHDASARVIEGPTLVAKKGGHAAKVIVKTSLQKGTCFNTTTLWIADTGSSAKEGIALFVHRPKSEYNSGSGMNPVDWSPNGRLLLTEFWQWNQQPNDAGIDKQILLFSADGKTKLEIDTARFWGDQKGKNCGLEFELLGFTPSGQVAIRGDVKPYYEPAQDPSEVPPDKRCIEKHETWAVDPYTQRRVVLPAGFHAERYSETKSAPATTSK